MLRRTLPAALAPALLLPFAGQAQMNHGDHDGPMPGHEFHHEIMKDAEVLREKLVGLANAIPDDKWDWRPGEGVRSVGETFLHVAADNYFIPTAVGGEIPSETGIVYGDYGTVRAYEAQDLTPDEIRAQLVASFDYLDALIHENAGSDLDEGVTLFGRDYTVRGVWMLQAVHVHEHLGQMIAYARMNGITPPWSR